MPFHSRSRKRDHAGWDLSTPGTLDAVDPAVFFGSSARRDGPDRKTYQLCKQALRSLTIALAGECNDELLREVIVDSVTPAPDASRLLVTVIPTTTSVDTQAVLDSLQAHKPQLRAAVASAIHRKRAPELMFCVGWPEEVEE